MGDDQLCMQELLAWVYTIMVPCLIFPTNNVKFWEHRPLKLPWVVVACWLEGTLWPCPIPVQSILLWTARKWTCKLALPWHFMCVWRVVYAPITSACQYWNGRHTVSNSLVQESWQHCNVAGLRASRWNAFRTHTVCWYACFCTGQAVAEAACSGDEKFFLGTDSAPHPKGAKVRIDTPLCPGLSITLTVHSMCLCSLEILDVITYTSYSFQPYKISEVHSVVIQLALVVIPSLAT